MDPETISRTTDQYRCYPAYPWCWKSLFYDFLYLRLRYKLNSCQHGFRREHSTITQLIIYLDELYSNFDDNVEQVLIYLDFAKAFDTVNHAVLLDKLALYGLGNIFLKLIFFLLK